MTGREPTPLEIHKALADDTRFRLYRFLRLSGRPVSVRELSARLSLHPNTLRPHLRRLEEVGLVASETRKGASVGRPQTLYAVALREDSEGGDYRLLAEVLAGLLGGTRSRDRAQARGREWGEYLVAQGTPKPGARQPARRNLAVLQEAMAAAGFDPRFRRLSASAVEISLRVCPFRELVDDYRELVCAVHLGLLEGMLHGLRPPLSVAEFEPFAQRTVCRLVARGRTS
jgi:predicted ArsR family transcriptional regulator